MNGLISSVSLARISSFAILSLYWYPGIPGQMIISHPLWYFNDASISFVFCKDPANQLITQWTFRFFFLKRYRCCCKNIILIIVYTAGIRFRHNGYIAALSIVLIQPVTCILNRLWLVNRFTGSGKNNGELRHNDIMITERKIAIFYYNKEKNQQNIYQ